MHELSADERTVEPSTQQLGRRISQLRHAQGITIATLSTSAELSSGLLSQIERGHGNPSYTTLLKLARALEVPVSDFFARSEGELRERVVRKGARRLFLNYGGDISFEVLTPDLHGRLAMVWGIAGPGWTNRGAPYVHEGDGEECLFVISGTLEVTVSGVRYVLDEGDSITFPSSEEHWYENTSSADVIIVQAITPPNF